MVDVARKRLGGTFILCLHAPIILSFLFPIPARNIFGTCIGGDVFEGVYSDKDLVKNYSEKVANKKKHEEINIVDDCFSLVLIDDAISDQVIEIKTENFSSLPRCSTYVLSKS